MNLNAYPFDKSLIIVYLISKLPVAWEMYFMCGRKENDGSKELIIPNRTFITIIHNRNIETIES